MFLCLTLLGCPLRVGVRIPEVLVPFMGGLTFLPFVRDSKLEEGSKIPPAVKKAPAAAPAAPKEKVAACLPSLCILVSP